MKEREPHIFLDCDGVLADFDSYAQPILGVDLPPRQAEEVLGSERFWELIRNHPDFYTKLPLMRDAKELFEAVAGLKPTILTGCPQGGWAECQKLAWSEKHFPGTAMITCAARNKRDHMQPGDVLIDDTLKYRHLWEEAGGVFIHHTSAAESISELRRLGILRED